VRTSGWNGAFIDIYKATNDFGKLAAFSEIRTGRAFICDPESTRDGTGSDCRVKELRFPSPLRSFVLDGRESD